MSDPLSICASVAGLVALTKEIIKVLKDYMNEVRSAPDDAMRLTTELVPLEIVLQKLRDFLEEEDANGRGNFRNTSALYCVIEICKLKINTLYEKLKRLRRKDLHWLRSLEQWKWPFDKDKCCEIAETLHRCVQTFHFSLTIENCKLLSKTSEELKQEHELMRHVAQFAPEVSKTIEDLSNIMKLAFQRIEDKVDIVGQSLNTKLEDDKNKEYLNMLFPGEPLERHWVVRSSRLDDAGSWLLQDQRFINWRDGNDQDPSARILCCYGIPGAGKTVISSIVIEHLKTGLPSQASRTSACACLYSDYRDQQEHRQTFSSILGSLAKQFLVTLDYVPQEVAKILEDIRKQGYKVEAKNTLEILKLTLRQFDRTYICLDALDELRKETRKELLQGIQGSKLGLTRIFLTGRHHIRDEVSEHLGSEQQNSITITANMDDIRAYLTSRIAQCGNQALDTQLKENIITTIAAKSQGIFLLPALHIAMVLEKTTNRKIQNALQALPDGLDTAFADRVDRVCTLPKDQAALGMKVLMWLHFARRPLSVGELGHALAVEENDTDLDEKNIPPVKTLLDCCLGLVLVDEATSTVRFVHYSLEEFFQRTKNKYFPNGLSYVARICLTYLNFKGLTFLCSTSEELDQQMAKFAFLVYASCHWGDYVREQCNHAVRELALKLMQQAAEHCHCAMQILFRTQPCYGILVPSRYSGIHALAFLGLNEILRYLPSPQNWNSQDDLGRTPLACAAEEGNEAVVRFLIAREDVDINLASLDGRTPLSFAIRNGNEAIVQLLLSCESVDVNSEYTMDMTALSYAAIAGDEAVVRMLLGRQDVDADRAGQVAVAFWPHERQWVHKNNGRTPLSYAAGNGHETVVRLLLERTDVDADSNKRTDYIHTPLSPRTTRTNNGDEYEYEVVMHLLREHEEINAASKDNDGRTPLTWAEEGVVPEWIETEHELWGYHRREGYNDWEEENGRTPLSYAAGYWWKSILRLFLQHPDVEADSKDVRGRTPLSWAASGSGCPVEQEAVVRLLLQCEGVDANSRDDEGRTPLSYAAQYGCEAVVRLLLDRGDVDADSKDYRGRTALSFAALHGHEVVVQLLLGREDVYADSKDYHARTPLSFAAEYDHAAVMQLLLARADVDVNSKDCSGRTPLSWAVGGADALFHYGEAALRLLLDYEGVDVDSRDTNGRTPLSWAAGTGRGPAVRLLLEHKEEEALQARKGPKGITKRPANDFEIETQGREGLPGKRHRR